MKLTDRVYQELTHDERFHAVLEAFARKDLAEIDRLNDTVQEITIRSQSPGYFERLRGFQQIAMVYGIQARDLMLGWTAVLMRSRLHELAAAGATVEDSEIEDSIADDDAQALLDISARLKAHRDAWAQFCSDLTIDPSMPDFSYYSQLCDLVGPYLDLPELERNEDNYAETLEWLHSTWRHRLNRVRSFGNGPELLEKRKAN